MRKNKPALIDPATAHEQHDASRRGVARIKSIRQQTAELAAQKAQGRKPPILMGTQLDGRASTNLVKLLHEAGLLIDQTNLGDDIPWTQNNSTVYISYEGVALRVQHEDGTERIVVDTTSPAPAGSLQLRSAADLILYRSNNAGVPIFRIDGQNGALLGGGSAPTIAIGAAGGSGASASILFGNDTWMYIVLTAGSSGMAIGTAATVTFNVARPTGDFIVGLHPLNQNAADFMAANGVYAPAATVGTFTITVRGVVSAGVSYHFAAFVGGLGA